MAKHPELAGAAGWADTSYGSTHGLRTCGDRICRVGEGASVSGDEASSACGSELEALHRLAEHLRQ